MGFIPLFYNWVESNLLEGKVPIVVKKVEKL